MIIVCYIRFLDGEDEKRSGQIVILKIVKNINIFIKLCRTAVCTWLMVDTRTTVRDEENLCQASIKTLHE